MKTVLSIQSHVVHGYVGNRAAVFPLQRMGIDVKIINTVQFSNHTGYGTWTGTVFDGRHIQDLIAGLEAQGILKEIDAVLSGYLGRAALGKIVTNTVSRIRQDNPDLIYCCDPVMGDTDGGLYVDETIPAFFAEQALESASILTPNQFELGLLTEQDIDTLDDVKHACRKLHARGPAQILVTSVKTDKMADDSIGMLLSTAGKSPTCHFVETPYLPITPSPNGAGDMTAALYLGHILCGSTPVKALEETAANIHTVFRETQKQGGRELAILAAQDSFMSPEITFKAQNI